ncbi:hypothetical protein [Neorhizobium galegae]|uniref:hypothetical protein n=1 Tax=Neorhizobium galegae TaxID=399 RepID=UPI000627A603
MSPLPTNPLQRPRSPRGLSFARCSTFRRAGFSSRLERSRFINALRGYRQKIHDIDFEGFCDAFDDIERGIEVAALKPADCRAIDVSVNRKIFLGDRSGSSDRPKIPCNTRAKLHARMGNILSLFYPSDISDIMQSLDAVDPHYRDLNAQPARLEDAVVEETK